MMRILTIGILCLFFLTGYAAPPRVITVSHKGKADFRSIQGAINSLTRDYAGPASRVIFIKKGIYNEKLYLEKNHVTLVGEDAEKTIITQSIARDAWRCMHTEDWGVATLNVDGNDVTLKNLTIINNYGFNSDKEQVIHCQKDSLNQQKIIRKNGHQMAMRTMNATRLQAINCIFKAFGGDTVSPWNVKEGMFYFKNCRMEGGVDFYCPRGWAWAEDCVFYAHGGDAAIWHDGSMYKDSKTVLVNCFFDGYKGFNLGRYHRDAAFYLLGCTFSENMADRAIYRVPTTNTIQWGERIFYANCHRKAGDFAWFKNNLSDAPGSPDVSTINLSWLFGKRWHELTN